MIWQRMRPGRPPAGMLERWQQVYRDGEAELEPFTQAELGSVTLDAGALPGAERGPFLQAVTPLLTGQGQAPDAAAEGWGPAVGRSGAEMAGSAVAARAGAVAGLERRGFLRPGSPAPAAGPAPGELAGWAVGPDGDLAARRQVTLVGDLAVITRIRAQPVWVAEVSVSPQPTRPDPAETGRVLARMYAPYRPPVGLLELTAGPDGSPARYLLLRDDRAVRALVGWCGADVTAATAPGGRAPDRPGEPGAGEPGADGDTAAGAATPTAELAGTFAAVAQLRVAQAQGERVLLRVLVVATAGKKHWLLDGEWWQRAVPVTVDELGQRVSAMLKPP